MLLSMIQPWKALGHFSGRDEDDGDKGWGEKGDVLKLQTIIMRARTLLYKLYMIFRMPNSTLGRIHNSLPLRSHQPTVLAFKPYNPVLWFLFLERILFYIIHSLDLCLCVVHHHPPRQAPFH